MSHLDEWRLFPIATHSISNLLINLLNVLQAFWSMSLEQYACICYVHKS